MVTEDKIAVHTIMRGIHTGDFFGISPTRNNIEVQQMQIERIENGLIVEHWRITDDISLMQQLEQL